MSELSDSKLIASYGEIIAELRRREIVRTKNIVGDLGERYCVQHCNIELSETNKQDIDAVAANGDRYSVKSVSEGSAKRTSAFHLEKEHCKSDVRFEFLLVVILSETMQLQNIYSYTWDQFWDLKSWSNTQKAYFLSLSKSNLGKGKVVY